MGREINKHNKIRNKKIHNLVESLSSLINLQEQSIETPINWKIVGTSPFRRASNGTSAFKNIRKSLDINGDILSSQEEGKLSYIGVNKIMPESNKVVIDFGGGSTEFTYFDKSYNVESKDFGTADIRNIIGKYPVEEHLQNIGMKFLENQLSRLNTRVSEKSVIFCGGTARNLYEYINNGKSLDRNNIASMNPSSLYKAINELCNLTIQEINDIKFINKYRAEVLLSGLLIMKAILEHFDLLEFKISPIGLREGVASTLI